MIKWRFTTMAKDEDGESFGETLKKPKKSAVK